MVNSLLKTESVKSKLVLKIAAGLIFVSVGAFLFVTYGSREENLTDKLTQASAAGDIPQVLALLDQRSRPGSERQRGQDGFGTCFVPRPQGDGRIAPCSRHGCKCHRQIWQDGLDGCFVSGPSGGGEDASGQWRRSERKGQIPPDSADVRIAQGPQGVVKVAFGERGRR